MTTQIETRPAPRWRRRKDARPAEILASALETFSQRGYEATRLEDVARKAGCTKGTIFLYYRNKAELFKAAVRESVAPLIEANERLVEEHVGGTRELLEKLLRRRWEHVAQNRIDALVKLMLAEAHAYPELARFIHDEVFERSQSLLRRVLERGMARGEFRPLDVDHTARFVVAPMLFALVWRHAVDHAVESRFSMNDYFETALRIMLEGLSAEPAPALSRS